MIKTPISRRAIGARLAIAGAVLGLGIQAATGGVPGTLAAQPSAIAAATMPPMTSALPATTCPAILPPKPRPYPGLGNPDARAPLGDYGDAPDGSFPFPAYSLSGNFPTLWHHGGAYTRVVNQEWLGARVSTERGATDPFDPDGHPNLLFLGSTPLAANLDCHDDSNPSLDLAAKIFQANVTVAAGAPRVRRVLNVVADLNLSGKWDAPKEWLVRNCTFVVPSPFSGRIQCPLVGSSTLSPLFTQGTIVKPGRIICPPKVWYRILLDRDPIVAGTIPGPWAGWDGHGPKAGFGYGEVEDYLCPCDGRTDPTATNTPTATATPTVGKQTYTPTATATATPTCTVNTDHPCGTRTKTPTATPTCTPNAAGVPCGTATNTATATPTCTPNTGVPCGTQTNTATATPTCTPNPLTAPCGTQTNTATATPTCTPNTGVPCGTATSTPSPTPTCAVPVPGTTLCATATNSPTVTPTCTPNPRVPCGTVTSTPSPTPTCTVNGSAAPCGTATSTVTATPTCVPTAAGVPCTKLTTLDITVKHDYGAANGIAVFCPVINLSYLPAAQTNDLEWIGAPWIGATTGTLPAGWAWDTTFVGGVRAYTTNTPPWPSTGGTPCFNLQVPANTILPSPVVISATHNGVIIGYINA